MKLRDRLSNITGGQAATPLLVLFGLNFVDEFDRIAFAALTPEIRDAFDIGDSTIVAVGVLTSIFVLVAALPIGVLGDRASRVKISAFAAILWGTMSVLTGVVPALALLFLVRLFAGLGRVINEVVHPSLLSDYYKPEHQPRVFLVHRLANPLSAVAGLLVGLIGELLGWRWAFILLAIPTFLLIGTLAKLREPNRGESVDAELAADNAGQPAVAFSDSRRQLFAIATLRRLWLGAVFLGVGSLSIGQFLSLFFENVYGWSPFGRGVVQFVFGAGGVVGLFIGGRLASRATAPDGDRSQLATITGLSFVQFAVFTALLAVAPWSGLSLVFAFFLSFGLGSYLPAYLPLVGLVSPPRVRSQAYAFAILFVGLGGIGSIPLASVGENSGYRLAIVILAGIVAVAGFVGASARGTVIRDIEQAEASLDTARQMRLDKAAGGGALLVCRNVEVAYDQVQVLFGVDMDVQRGEIVALLGTNGAGKSTLLKAISGVTDPIGGAIYFDGQDITHMEASATTATGVIQVPGGKAVFPTLTVAEHLRAAGWLYRDDPQHLEQSTAEVLEIFPRLQERIDQMAGNLSGGEQQMLALGMAFIAKPKLLMIDELSLGLAPAIVEQLLGIVRKIQESGTAIILVEQSINVALTVADRAYFMEKGEVRFEGPTEALLERDDIVRSVFLEGAAAATGDNEKKKSSVTTRERRVVEPDEQPVLSLRSVSKRFGGIRAVDDTSFDLYEGEILGLIGPNGAGKTTIFDIISGFLIPEHGRIDFIGEDVTKLGPDKRAWMGLGRSFQDARLAGSLTVSENIAIGLERHLHIRDHLASMLNLPLVVRQEEDVSWTVDDLIELMNLGAFRDKFVRELSTGSRRIVDLAMCVAHDPTVLLLDEPSSGIAQKETEALGPLLTRIQAETGCALLIIEHDMPLITGISDRMIALELGHPIVEGTPDEVISDPQVVSSYLGGDMATINRSGNAPAGLAPNGPPESQTVNGRGRPPRRREPLRAGK